MIQLSKWREINGLMLKYRKYHMEYKGFLSNHLAWIVTIGLELNITQEEYQHAIDQYTTKLEPAVRSENDDLETNYRGEFFDNFQAFYDELIEQSFDTRGINKEPKTDMNLVEMKDALGEIVKNCFPHVMKGVSGAALHPLILLGTGLYFVSPVIVADALAYLHVRDWEPLIYDSSEEDPPISPSSSSADSFKDILADFVKIADEKELKKRCDELISTFPYSEVVRGKFQKRLLAWRRDTQLCSHIESTASRVEWHDPTQQLQELSVFVAGAVQASNVDFFVLHGYTSLWSLTIILPYLDKHQQQMACAEWFKCLLGVVAAQKFPSIFCDIQETDNSWDNILRTAFLSHEDEHNFKCCWMMYDHALKDPPNDNVYRSHANFVANNPATFL